MMMMVMLMMMMMMMVMMMGVLMLIATGPLWGLLVFSWGALGHLISSRVVFVLGFDLSSRPPACTEATMDPVLGWWALGCHSAF